MLGEHLAATTFLDSSLPKANNACVFGVILGTGVGGGVGPAMPIARPHSAATPTAWAGHSRWWSICLIRKLSFWAAACRIFRRFTATCPNLAVHTSFRTIFAPTSCLRCTAIRPAYAVPPGCGINGATDGTIALLTQASPAPLICSFHVKPEPA